MGSEANSSTAGKPIRCTAAVLWVPGEKEKLETIVVAAPTKDQVRLKVVYTAICHSDVTVAQLQDFAPLCPAILGHEGVGIVESVGEGVTSVKPGDHVLPFMLGQCGQCSTCKGGRTNVCSERPVVPLTPTLFGTDKPHLTTEDGKVISCFAGLSTFSEYAVIHKENVIKINPEAPLDKIGLVSCALATGFGAVWNIAKVTRGSSAAVFGLGSIGLAAVQACKIAGASRIIGVDINSSKVDVAKQLGLTDFVNPKEHESPLSQVIKELTGGRGVEYSFECVGNVKLMADAVQSTTTSGTTVIMGVPSVPGATFEVGAMDIIYGKTIHGGVLGNYKTEELAEVVERAMRKEFEMDPYITHRLPFSKINEAMEIFHSGKCLRCVLEMGS